MNRPKTREEPNWITAETLSIIHARQIERFGGLHGVLDENVVLAAIARPINRWAYDASADLAHMASVYLVAFVGTQGFNDGNKRTGVACALLFLQLNGLSLNAELDELYDLTLAVATNQVKDEDVSSWIRERLPL